MCRKKTKVIQDVKAQQRKKNNLYNHNSKIKRYSNNPKKIQGRLRDFQDAFS